MVPTAWLLLNLSCKATDLGVILPEKGVNAISQEDLKRDLWLHAQAEGDWTWYRQRMQEMGRLEYPTSEGICVGKRQTFSLVGCDEGTLTGALTSAAFISLAKSLHHSDREISICLYFSCANIDDYDLWIQDLTGLNLQVVGRRVYTDDTVSTPSALNYLRIQKHLQRLAKEHLLLE